MSVHVVLLSLVGVAEASPEAAFDIFRQEIVDQQYKSALKKASDVEDALLEPSDLISANLLPDFWMYRGVAYWERRKRDLSMDAWRQALRIDIHLLKRAEATGIFSVEQLDIIAALTQEIMAQHEYRLDIPSQTGQIQYFLDGNLVQAGKISYEGRHLLQINCPLDPFQSIWLNSLRGIDWLSYCPSGMGAAKAVGIPGLGDLSGLPSIPPIQVAEPTIVEPKQTDISEPDKTVTETPPTSDEPKVDYDPSSDQVKVVVIPSNDIRDMAGMACMIGGGALVAGGAVMHFTTVRPRFFLVEDARTSPATVTRAQADQLSASFNSARWTTIALLGAGAAISGSGAAVYFTASDMGIPMVGGAWSF